MQRALRFALIAGLLAAPQLAVASDRAPVAVLWMGDLDSDVGEKIVDDVNGALAHKKSVRPLDSTEDRRVLVEGGPAAKATTQLRAAEALLSRAKLADAATELEAAETTLFGDVPFDAMMTRFADLERLLLTTYDQLGRPADAARAASRVRMAPGSIDDIKVLVDRHSAPAGYGAALPPVEIVTQPPGAHVYRDLTPSGETPTSVAGGNRNIDFVDVQAPGFRRAHMPLGMGGRIELTLVPEDRLGVLVDRVRDQAPDAPAADVAALGKRIGAVRVLVLMPDGPRKLLARWLDVATAKWSDATLRVDNAGQVAMDRIATYCAPNEDSPGAGAQLVVQQPAAPPPKKKLGIWGKWYTWVAAGGVVALVVGLLVAQNVGSDKVTVTSSH